MRLETSRNCTGCGRPMAFVRSAVSRQIMTLDPEPVPNGNIVVREGLAVVLKKNELFAAGEAPAEGEPRYLDHHVTCPNAKEFRRNRKR